MTPLANRSTVFSIIVLFTCLVAPAKAQETTLTRDSIVVRRIYRDTVIYKYDTIRIKYYVRTDTVWNSSDRVVAETEGKKRAYNPNNWGIGPSVGAYYSPFSGFDVSIGFGVQYYLFAVPSFRNPHTRNKKERHHK